MTHLFKFQNVGKMSYFSAQLISKGGATAFSASRDQPLTQKKLTAPFDTKLEFERVIGSSVICHGARTSPVPVGDPVYCVTTISLIKSVEECHFSREMSGDEYIIG